MTATPIESAIAALFDAAAALNALEAAASRGETIDAAEYAAATSEVSRYQRIVRAMDREGQAAWRAKVIAEQRAGWARKDLAA